MKQAIVGAVLAGLVAWCHAGITILTGGEPKPYTGPASPGAPDPFYRLAVPNEFATNATQIPSSDSFIRGAIQAWAEHLHVMIRPDEIWFSILIQMSYYINSHPDAVGEVLGEAPSTPMEVRLEEVDWYVLVHRMRTRLQERYKADWMANWINPGFSTTFDADFMTASMIMLGTAKTNFETPGNISCGLPSVTLSGKQNDWEDLIRRIDKLPLFGPEAAEYGARLRPVLQHFVESFERPDSEAVKDFWNQIVTSKTSGRCGGTPHRITGWLTGFFYWDENGRPYGRSKGGLTLGNQTYPVLDLRGLPVSYARAPFGLLGFNGTERFQTYIVAGNLCKFIVDGPPDEYLDALNRTGGALQKNSSSHSTLNVLSSWAVLGPVQWNATGQAWGIGNETTSLGASITENVDNGTCALAKPRLPRRRLTKPRIA
ncbi:hypothetical protein GQ53DRAFT_799984 [Thozetella sp. PMI_491]|nr:hypothetical protein GQ53DRAFT_799984 [Thozetella sp. PMI_491]